jgi:tight adherence protein B
VAIGLTTFLIVSFGIFAGYQYAERLFKPRQRRIRRRLNEEFGQQHAAAPVSPLFKNLDQLSLDASIRLDSEGQERPAPPKPDKPPLQLLMEQAGVTWTAKQLFLIAAGSSLVLGLSALVFAGWFAGLAAVAAGAAAPFVYVHAKYRQRRQKYLKQLPSAFDLMARVIRSGQSVPQSLQAVADSLEDPIAGDFGACLKQQNLGLPPEVSFQEMANRCRILELRIFAMAMLIQRQTGGNLSEVLERLANLVRARLKLKQHVHTLTAEGRLQGWTLAALPFVVFAIMLVVNRPYAEVLFQHVPLIAGTLIMMGLGLLWIRKIVNIGE